METSAFKQKVSDVLSSIQKEVSVMKHDIVHIKKQVSEAYLTEQEEKLLDDALKHEK